MLEVAPYNWGH